MAENVGSWPGGLSARAIGRELGLTAQQVNVELKHAGLLYGEPGAYGLTERGTLFGKEHHHSNGVGGYSQYQVNYETRGWDKSVIAELERSMKLGAVSSVPAAIAESLPDPSVTAESPISGQANLSAGAIVALAVVLALLVSAGVLVLLYFFGPRKVRDRLRSAKAQVSGRFARLFSRGKSGSKGDTSIE